MGFGPVDEPDAHHGRFEPTSAGEPGGPESSQPSTGRWLWGAGAPGALSATPRRERSRRESGRPVPLETPPDVGVCGAAGEAGVAGGPAGGPAAGRPVDSSGGQVPGAVADPAGPASGARTCSSDGPAGVAPPQKSEGACGGGDAERPPGSPTKSAQEESSEGS